MKPEARDLTIVRLGAQGDGVAQAAEGHRFVPFALPGERVRVGTQGMPELRSAPSPERAAPACRHFGTCGGCVAQHMSEPLYKTWKRDIVAETFRQRGLDVHIEDLVPVPASSRRRAVLTAQRRGVGVTLGYHARRSDAVFDVEECPVLVPDIVRAVPGLKSIAMAAETGDVRFTVLATATGLDVAAQTTRAPTGRTVARLAAIGAQLRLARLSVNGDILLERAKPVLDIGGVGIVPHPRAFIQAVAEAEQAMAALVVKATEEAKRVADLFAGMGTFSLRLARRTPILAVDSDKAALAALQEAARHANGLKSIETRVRDLAHDPLSSRELGSFDAVVFDPPRAGAKAQAEALAGSRVATIVAVSCNPATLARDVRSLLGGGYRLETVTPIDQFRYSAHVEVVAVLRAGR